MQLRLADRAGRADLGDLLAAPHGLAALDQQRVVMRIGGHPAAGMLDQHQIAVAAQLVAGIGDHAGIGREHRRALGRGDVDAVIVRAARSRAVALDDLALDRPEEIAAARRRRGQRPFAASTGVLGGAGSPGLAVSRGGGGWRRPAARASAGGARDTADLLRARPAAAANHRPAPCKAAGARWRWPACSYRRRIDSRCCRACRPVARRGGGAAARSIAARLSG